MDNFIRCEFLEFRPSLCSNTPILIRNCSSSMNAFSWNLNTLLNVDLLQNIDLKVCPKLSLTEKSKHLSENDAFYLTSSLRDFLDWANSNLRSDSTLSKIPRSTFSLYHAYRHLKDFAKTSDGRMILNDLDWSSYTGSRVNSADSTLWIGSDGAYTPTHYDTYGVNFVAQIIGKKTWYLLPPNTSSMREIRIPYEESSVFTTEECTSLMKNQENCIKITLEPGDVLYVPKHWWHMVYNDSPIAVTVNYWHPVASDSEDRLRESIIKFLMTAMHSIEKDKDKSNWLSPYETISSKSELLSYIQSSINDLNEKGQVSRELSWHDLVFSCISPNVIEQIVKILKSHQN